MTVSEEAHLIPSDDKEEPILLIARHLRQCATTTWYDESEWRQSAPQWRRGQGQARKHYVKDDQLWYLNTVPPNHMIGDSDAFTDLDNGITSRVLGKPIFSRGIGSTGFLK